MAKKFIPAGIEVKRHLDAFAHVGCISRTSVQECRHRPTQNKRKGAQSLLTGREDVLVTLRCTLPWLPNRV